MRQLPLFLLALLPALPGCGGGGPALLASPLTLDEASQLVLDQVVGPSPGPVIVMAWPDAVRPGDDLRPYLMPGSDVAAKPLTIRRESWFFWIDDAPGAQFSHPTRFVLVEADTGRVSVTDDRWWPVLNGTTLWEGDGDWDAADRVFSNVTEPRLAGIAAAPGRALAQAAGGHFVGVNTWRPGETHQGSFEDDMENMTSLWESLGFSTSSFADPTNYPDADGPPSTEAVEAELKRIADETTGPVVIFVTGHGHVSKDGSVHVGRIHEDLLYDWLQLFPEDRDVTVILNGCHTGGMLEGEKGKLRADAVIAATDAAGESQGDVDGPTGAGQPDPNANDSGSEFVSSVVEGIFEAAQADPGDPPSALVRKAWDTILELDQAHQGGYTFPKISDPPPSNAAITVAPTPISFVHKIGVTECPQSIGSYTITNSGSVAVNVTVEPPTQITVQVQPKSGIPTTATTATLGPGQSVQVSVWFNCSTTTSFQSQIRNLHAAAGGASGEAGVTVNGSVGP